MINYQYFLFVLHYNTTVSVIFSCNQLKNKNLFRMKKILIQSQVSFIINLQDSMKPNNIIKGFTINENKQLGNGIAGKVYLCTKGGKSYAVKKIKKNPKKKQYEQAIQREVNILKELRHDENENIIQFEDYQADEDNHYIFMELCEEQSLADKLGKLYKKEQRIKEAEAIQYLFQIANAYFTLFQKKIIHRDIKPSNILFTNRDVLKLVDFGTSRFIKDSQYTKETGTKGYQSPQTLNGDPYTEKCDVFSIGATFYDMVVNEILFKQDSDNNKLVEEMKNWKLNKAALQKISKDCQDFLSKCLAYEQKDRISFEEILIHPIFKNKFYAKKYVSAIRFSLRINEKVFQVPPKQLLTLEQLASFLQKINPQIDMPKCRAIFKAYKEPTNDKISSSDLMKILSETQSYILKRTNNAIRGSSGHNRTILSLSQNIRN